MCMYVYVCVWGGGGQGALRLCVTLTTPSCLKVKGTRFASQKRLQLTFSTQGVSRVVQDYSVHIDVWYDWDRRPSLNHWAFSNPSNLTVDKNALNVLVPASAPRLV